MMHHHPILKELMESGCLTADQADAIHEEHLAQGKPVREIAIEQRFLNEAAYLATVARILGTEVVDLSTTPILPNLAKTVPASISRMYEAAPVRVDGNTVVFAVADWPSPAITDDIGFVLSRRIGYVVASKEDVEETILKLYGEESDSINELLSALESDLEDAGDLAGLGDAVDLADLEHAASATPVIRFVNLVLYQAVKDRASDIHFEPFEREFKIRYRVDGALYEMAPPPKNLALPIISRVKVISGLDIAESRLPQDGRIQLNVAGRSIDFRVSTLPTQFGESVVLRVLDRSNVQLDIDNIGFPDDIHDSFIEDIRKPNGIVIVTGPTGSGKTTTLYAALQRINQTETKILTAEDPVEYDVEGIIQLPIRENIGLTFASALRSFLRQDPDVIMVGEIRDMETAQIAIQASLTGHLVFSTLHTNDAPGAVTRLIDMDVEPYLIASTLEAVMGQRLVRTLCPDCRTAYRPDDDTLALLDLDRSQVGDQPFFRGQGCGACNNTGYSGRRAIFEYMRINDPLRTAIIERRPTLALRNKAKELGMRTLREDGIRCILDGYTTVEEVVQYT
ncbi:putative type II secretion system protein HxcR [Pontiella desulfatans]|uniref:Putative type II secretion system protein HxcR n=1 Tax=Pontiella desulfatans TaxID=2750659 RepID=A0A6C2U5B1_PONDE|nr:GspE/PulE family protein [Pontiella desulfatans]VGO14997.1 putative type II secretion system protein HxcR [Pontiella desulfatans]